MNIKDQIGKELDKTNEAIDAKLGTDTTEGYLEYLNKKDTNNYYIRPCGTVEFVR